MKDPWRFPLKPGFRSNQVTFKAGLGEPHRLWQNYKPEQMGSVDQCRRNKVI